MFTITRPKNLFLYDSHGREHRIEMTSSGECRLEDGALLDPVDENTFKHPVSGALLYRKPPQDKN